MGSRGSRNILLRDIFGSKTEVTDQGLMDWFEARAIGYIDVSWRKMLTRNTYLRPTYSWTDIFVARYGFDGTEENERTFAALGKRFGISAACAAWRIKILCRLLRRQAFLSNYLESTKLSTFDLDKHVCKILQATQDRSVQLP